MDPSLSNNTWAGLPLAVLPTQQPYGFEDYLASGVGLTPVLGALALGGPITAGVISENQLIDWGTASTPTGVSITGLEDGVGLFSSMSSAASYGTDPCPPYPCPPPPEPIPYPQDDPGKSTPPLCDCPPGNSVTLCEATGSIKLSAPTGTGDVQSGSGIRSPLQWSSNSAAANSAIAGNGWSYSSTPKLILRQSDTLGPTSIALPFNATDVRTFQRSATDPSLYLRSVGGGPTDLLRKVGNELHYQTADGTTIRFGGFSSAVSAPTRGQYLGESDAGGNRVVATLNSNGTIAERRGFQAGSATADEVQTFTFTGATATTSGRLSTLTVSRADGTVLRQSQFSYYTTTTSVGGVVVGRAGDLKDVVIRDGSGNELDRSSYRYSQDARGRTLVAYVFDAESVRRLTTAGFNSNTATNTQLAPYAKDYFAYDSHNRVIRHDQQGEGCSNCTGGIGSFTYNYATNPNSTGGFNSWKYKTTETGPDGNQTITYSNSVGQEMLSVKQVLVDPANPSLIGKQWGTFTAYDDTTGLAVLKATPESVQLPASLTTLEGYNDLLHKVGGNYQYLADDLGAITRTTYGASSSATETLAGDVRGFVKDVALTRGELGSAVPQMDYSYFSRSVSLGGATKTVNPLASLTQYRNDDGTGAQTTTYSYQWYLNSTQASLITTTLPVVGVDQNGPGSAAVSSRAFDQVGRETWSKDVDGFLIYTEYDAVSGSVVKRIEDVNTALTGTYTGLPAGWSTPAGGGLHLTTTYALDSLGRQIRETDPNGNVDVTVFNDVNHSQRIYIGWNSSTGQAMGPTRVSRMDLSGTYNETLTMSATPTTTGGLPTGSESISNLESLSRSYLNAAGQVIYRDDYFNLSGITWSTAANLGVEGVNFYRTSFSYNKQGLLDRTQAPTGTISLSKFDGMERLSSSWIGTDSSNLVQVAVYTYDDNGVGNGNLTQSVALPGIGANRVSEFAYDWRDRLVASKSGVEATENAATNRPVIYQSYDNLNQVITRGQYDGDGVAIDLDTDANGIPDAPDPANRRRFSRDFYDNQGRQFRSQDYLVDQSTGAVYDVKQQSDNWFDKRGNTIQSSVPNGPASQYRTDGAGRLIQSFTLGNVPSGSWADANSLSNSVVLEQQESSYDGNSNLIQSTSRQRFHDASPTATGALGTASSGIRARVSTSTAYYDAADRLTASVDLGTNGGSAYSRPPAPPARSDTELVSTYSYDSAGRLKDLTDPRGLVARTLYDALGRRTCTIANATGGAPGTSTDVTANYTYDGNNNLLTLEAVQPAGTPSQITRYLYQARTATGSAINSNDLLSGQQYPDKVAGTPSASDQETYTLNALGDRLSLTDRNGTLHSYGYDVVGRQVSDSVATLGAGVDGSVRRIELAYDGAGLAALVTSFGAATGGSVLNQVGRVFNGFGQLTIEWQSHTGAIDLATTPKVSYGYSLTTGGNHSRLTGITYPDGFGVAYGYDSGIDNAISRLSRLSEGSGGPTLESFRYLGLGTVVERARPEVGITLSLVSQSGFTGDGGDQYTGLDRFGRLVDQRWFTGSGAGAVDVDRYGYTYDRNSNRLTGSNALQASLSESYTFDGLNQLESFQRAGTVAPSDQQWALDALGNWTTLTTDGVPENRTANAQNQYTTVGTAALTYSGTGNLTTDQEGRTLVYDAWNRLFSVKNSGGTLLAHYGYDGLKRRITEQVATVAIPDAATAAIRDLFYSADWQVLEERLRTGGAIPATADTRYVWSPVYVDAMVLRDRNADGNSATGPGGLEERLFVLQDGNWNTTALIAAAGVPGKATGDVIQRFAYTPYGQMILLKTEWAEQLTPPDVPWQHLFQGLKFTDATGLQYARNRDYSGNLGRFIELDPLGHSANDTNLYRFGKNSPLDHSDPFGLFGLGRSVVVYRGGHFVNPGPSAPWGWNFVGPVGDINRANFNLGGATVVYRGGHFVNPGPSAPWGWNFTWKDVGFNRVNFNLGGATVVYRGGNLVNPGPSAPWGWNFVGPVGDINLGGGKDGGKDGFVVCKPLLEEALRGKTKRGPYLACLAKYKIYIGEDPSDFR